MNHRMKRIIAGYEMIGGIIGILIAFSLVFNNLSSLLNLSLLLVVMVFYSLSFLGGLFLWQKKKRGLILSITTQILQVPQFSIGGITYVLFSGAVFSISTKVVSSVASFNFNVYLGSNFSLNYLDTANPPNAIGINLLAIALIIYLVKEGLNKRPNDAHVNTIIDNEDKNMQDAPEEITEI